MKVIGNVSKSKYLVEIDHSEIEKFLDRYGYQKENLEGLKPGDEVDLGKGYQFHVDALGAMKKTDEFIKSNKKVIETIMTGISVAAGDGDEADND